MADKGKEVDAIPLGGTAIKPPGWDRTGFEAFKYMLYNPETGEVLTRTPISWAKIIIFYCIYYSLLAGFWVAALHIFFMTLPETDQGPSWTLKSSLIGDNPGVGLRPKNSDERIDSQMFVLKIGEKSRIPSHKEGEGDTNADYAQRLKNFLDIYEKEPVNYNKFDIASQLKECSEFPYGYVAEYEKDENGEDTDVITKDVEPCIILKLNTIWNWQPTAVNSSYINKDKEPLPEKLKAHIKAREDNGEDTNQIWIDCNGRYPADQEALADMEYFPASRGFPISYFPYTGRGKFNNNVRGDWDDTYHAPLIAIKIKPKKETVGQLVHIECKSYYKDVIHSSKEKQGMVQFEVQVKTYI